MPQGPERSEADEARFKQGLASMAECAAPRARAVCPPHHTAVLICGRLFDHPYTIVLAVRTPIPSGDYEITRPYEKRAWCHVELRLASLVKHSTCLWDLRMHKEGRPIDFEGCQSLLQSPRPPLTSPEQLAKELHSIALH